MYEYFGNGSCEPNATEREIFTTLNLVRTDPQNALIVTALNNIAASFSGTISTYDYYGTGLLVNRNTDEGVTAVNDALAYLALRDAETARDALEWSPGLYMAC